MPSDIRSFFGGKIATPIREKETKKEDDSKKKRSSMKFELLYAIFIC
jgi:replication factor C subunit 1